MPWLPLAAVHHSPASAMCTSMTASSLSCPNARAAALRVLLLLAASSMSSRAGSTPRPARSLQGHAHAYANTAATWSSHRAQHTTATPHVLPRMLQPAPANATSPCPQALSSMCWSCAHTNTNTPACDRVVCRQLLHCCSSLLTQPPAVARGQHLCQLFEVLRLRAAECKPWIGSPARTARHTHSVCRLHRRALHAWWRTRQVHRGSCCRRCSKGRRCCWCCGAAVDLAVVCWGHVGVQLQVTSCAGRQGIFELWNVLQPLQGPCGGSLHTCATHTDDRRCPQSHTLALHTGRTAVTGLLLVQQQAACVRVYMLYVYVCTPLPLRSGQQL